MKENIVQTDTFKIVAELLGDAVEPKLKAFIKLFAEFLDEVVTPEEFVDTFDQTVLFVADIEGYEVKQCGFQDHFILFIDEIFPHRFTNKVVTLFLAKFLEKKNSNLRSS